MHRRLTLAAAALVCLTALPARAEAHGPPKITAGPPATTTDRGATFIFTYDEPAPTQAFECSLDNAPFAPCTDPELPEGHQVYKDLAPGAHVFQVRRVSQIDGDPLGDATPAKRNWTIEGPAPAPVPAPQPESPPPPAPEAAAPAEAEAPPGRPVPCGGVVQITDPAADSHHSNPDVLRAWLRRDAGHSTVAIEVSDLTPKIDHEENQRVFWRLLFTAPDGTRRYVDAAIARGQSTATYSYGRADGLDITREGTTTGAVFKGSPGIVQIALPDALAPAGATIREPVVVSGEEGDLVGPSYFDRAPGGDDPTDPKETSVGADWRVGACAFTRSVASGDAAAGSDTGTAPGGVLGFSLLRAKLAVRYGKSARVVGTVMGAAQDTPVELVDAAGKVLARSTTEPTGRVTMTFRPQRTQAVRVRAGGLSSGTVLVRVRSAVRLLSPDHSAGALHFRGIVAPVARGVVEIERRAKGGWDVVGVGRVRHGRFSVDVRRARAGRFRAVVARSLGAEPSGRSAVRRVRR